MFLRSIEHVYLAYSGGTPLVHLSRFAPEDADPDLIASMFAAVQTFMDDSFHSLGIGRVRSIEMDRHQHVAFGRGEHALLYVLYCGWESNHLERKVESTVQDIERRFGDLLRDWNGDMDRIAPLSEYLKHRFGIEADLHVHEPAEPPTSDATGPISGPPSHAN
jgi:hypothetical protein